MMRYARYTAAMLFVLLALGFVSLWVRSFQHTDTLQGEGVGAFYFLSSENGRLYLQWNRAEGAPAAWPEWSFKTSPPSSNWRFATAIIGFGYLDHWLFGRAIALPHWAPALSSLAIAALFVFKRNWRYSLRTILVATTVVAVVLGLAVWAV
jgi:hypothetical protein